MASNEHLPDLGEIAVLRAFGEAQGWSIPRIVEEIVDRFGVSRLKAHRLARGWTRPEAVERVLATYDADGLARPGLTPHRLCGWEHDPQVRPGEDYLDRLCRVYTTRADQLGYGCDYTGAETASAPSDGPAAVPAPDIAGGRPCTAYAGDPLALPALPTGEEDSAGQHLQPNGEENATNRGDFVRGLGAASLATLLDRSGRATARLSGKLGKSNLGPVTLEQLELRAAGFAQAEEITPRDELFRAVLAQQEEVETLLDGAQPLSQRRGLYRIAGRLSVLLGHLAWDLGDYATARTHLLTAWQLASEASDSALIARVRMVQSHVSLWAGDLRSALDYAHDGQRYASGVECARLAARCEARVYARMSDSSGVIDALSRAQRAMPSGSATEDLNPIWAYTPADLELHTGISLLWLGDPKRAEPHVRRSIALYQQAPPALRSPSDHAHAMINLAICLARQDQLEGGLRLITNALEDSASREANLVQAGEFLAALTPQQRALTAAHQFIDQLRCITAARTRNGGGNPACPPSLPAG